ncbi:MAG: hypothetical protein LUB59_03625 [Candidatus Gastranaerophilales bacterium]|nr:hypothetical protein [Candidatus Gastranaerophilales bacterium]
MSFSLSKVEQETIICYNEAEKTASVYTHNGPLRKKLERLAQERPDECRLERTSHEGQAVDYIVPKKWVKVSAGRQWTEEQRQVAAEHGRNFGFQPKKTDSLPENEG